MLNKKEIKKLAKDLAKINTLYWDVICMTEGFNKTIQENGIKSININEEEFYKQLAEEYKKIDKNDEDFISVELHSADFQDYDFIKSRVEENLD
jgi:hypothetical protein